MMTDNLWISSVDHRISTAIVFFLLLLLLGNKKRRRLFPLRMGIMLLVMCVGSWCIRYANDYYLSSIIAQGVGASLHILAMTLMYLIGYHFCYFAMPVELAYVDMMALTVFKLAWNSFKTGSYVTALAGMPSLWSVYSVMGAMVSYLVYFAVCLFTCGLCGHLVETPSSDVPARPFIVASVSFTACQAILEFCGHVYTSGSTTVSFLYYMCALMYTVSNFIVLLTLAQLSHYRRDNEDMHHFIRNKMQYYQMSRDGIASLQIKCHDLKHQIAAIRSEVGKANFEQHINRLEDSLIEYGTVVECGNETINIVLTEKNILCSTCGIKFSYIIDGALFDFMSEMEIYSLFGNALDNALECCSKLSDPHRRVISLKGIARGDMVVLHVENGYDVQPTLVDGMPVTTKSGTGHGFGLRSIQEIASKYGGAASVSAENHIFKLTVFLRPDRTRA